MAIAAAAVAVLVIGVVLAVVKSGPGSSPEQAAGSVTDMIGYRWRVVHVVDARGEMAVPESLHARIGFTRDGHVFGDDTVNFLSGRYEISGDGYVVHDTGTTLVGHVPGEPVIDRTIAAVDAMFFDLVDGPAADPRVARISVTVVGDTLTLKRGEFTLTLQRAGSEPNQAPPSPTTTATS